MAAGGRAFGGCRGRSTQGYDCVWNRSTETTGRRDPHSVPAGHVDRSIWCSSRLSARSLVDIAIDKGSARLGGQDADDYPDADQDRGSGSQATDQASTGATDQKAGSRTSPSSETGESERGRSQGGRRCPQAIQGSSGQTGVGIFPRRGGDYRRRRRPACERELLRCCGRITQSELGFMGCCREVTGPCQYSRNWNRFSAKHVLHCRMREPCSWCPENTRLMASAIDCERVGRSTGVPAHLSVRHRHPQPQGHR